MRVLLLLFSGALAFRPFPPARRRRCLVSRSSSNGGGDVGDWSSEVWGDEDEEKDASSKWSEFQPSEDNDGGKNQATGIELDELDDASSDAFLETIMSLQAQEVTEIEADQVASIKALEMLEAGVPERAVEAVTGKSVTREDEEELTVGGDSDVDVLGTIYDEDDEDYSLPSSAKVPLRPNGKPTRQRFVYVDEETCIGCTFCASFSPSTFYMEEAEGRARVFKQWGDTDDVVSSAIETCPVDCIHYVSWDDLQRLESEREEIVINRMARLVGGDSQRLQVKVSYETSL